MSNMIAYIIGGMYPQHDGKLDKIILANKRALEKLKGELENLDTITVQPRNGKLVSNGKV